MSKIIKITNASNLPLKESVQIPSSKDSDTSLKVSFSSYEASQHEMGIWECEVGHFLRQVKEAEYCHILKGECDFIYEDGSIISLKAGDSAYFPENTTGEWHIKETLLKSYFILND